MSRRRCSRQATPEQREQIEAYARGVNAGLKSLRSRPWEYIALQATPAQWKAEDTVLVPYAMWWDLQANSLRREQGAARDQPEARWRGVRGRMEVRAVVLLSARHELGQPERRGRS